MLFIAGHVLLTLVASLIAEHELHVHRLQWLQCVGSVAVAHQL